MTPNLEELMAQLRERQFDRALGGMESEVWRRIAADRSSVSSAALWGWRSAAAVLLLTVGLIVGGAPAPGSHDAGDFSMRAALAPATLLGEAP